MPPDSLKGLYADEMRDLWSANEQMDRIVGLMSEKAHDPKLKLILQRSVTGIRKHAETLKRLLGDAQLRQTPERCKGMDGLVTEATKHLTEEAPSNGELLDLVIIAQYQRMSHYGLAGFGTAMAYARALGMPDHALELQQIVTDIYVGDEHASRLAERAECLAAEIAV